MRSFFQTLQKNKVQATAMEKAFKEKVLSAIVKVQQGQPFQVISIALQNSKDLDVLISHEILHAQYLEYAGIRQSVREYWQTLLSESQQRKIKSLLQQSVSNSDSLEWILSEFFAYALELKADTSGKLKEFAQRQGFHLKKFIEIDTSIELAD